MNDEGALIAFTLISQMIIPGSKYWNMGIGREKGDVNDDAEGLEIMTTLGENMAWLLQRIFSRSWIWRPARSCGPGKSRGAWRASPPFGAEKACTPSEKISTRSTSLARK